MKESLVLKIRQMQMFITVLIFILVTSLCWHMNDMDITEIQLSAWGVTKTKWVWNISLKLIAIGLALNVYYYIKYDKRLKHKDLLYGLFVIPTMSLFFVAIFTTEFKVIHNVFAYAYFLSFPLVIYIMAFINRKDITYKVWIKHLLISSCMIVFPLILIQVFSGMAIAEIVHSIIVLVWNVMILNSAKK